MCCQADVISVPTIGSPLAIRLSMSSFGGMFALNGINLDTKTKPGKTRTGAVRRLWPVHFFELIVSGLHLGDKSKGTFQDTNHMRRDKRRLCHLGALPVSGIGPPNAHGVPFPTLKTHQNKGTPKNTHTHTYTYLTTKPTFPGSCG